MATFSGQAKKGWRYFSKIFIVNQTLKCPSVITATFFKSTRKSSFVQDTKLQNYTEIEKYAHTYSKSLTFLKINMVWISTISGAKTENILIVSTWFLASENSNQTFK